jgi:hypothetical protein
VSRCQAKRGAVHARFGARESLSAVRDAIQARPSVWREHAEGTVNTRRVSPEKHKVNQAHAKHAAARRRRTSTRCRPGCSTCGTRVTSETTLTSETAVMNKTIVMGETDAATNAVRRAASTCSRAIATRKRALFHEAFIGGLEEDERTLTT